MNQNYDTDVIIIGAGPSGTVSACLLRKAGYKVLVLEKSVFPRFVIGESLLPQCLITLEQAGCLSAVEQAGFQQKVGATFQHRGHYEKIIFAEKFSDGPSYAYHVERSQFDQILADCATEAGAEIRFNCTVINVKNMFDDCVIDYTDGKGQKQQAKARFILDASGYGRVLPRLLKIDKPSSLEPKASLFTHVEDGIVAGEHAREETLITTHPIHRDLWFWLISFSNGRSSVGVVGSPELIQPYQQQGIEGLKTIISEDPELSKILRHAQFDTQDYQINAYSGSVSQMYGDGYAVLGNAGEFLDPIFSSGVTVAMQSSKLAVASLEKMLKGQPVDWQAEFVDALMIGVSTFKTYVNNWYSGGLQDVIFARSQPYNVKSKIASILAGYAWDRENPFVAKPVERLNALIQICQE
ncbi:MAG: NAD(P)/FAD-dependent oxidoreductase [Marinicella sp.]